MSFTPLPADPEESAPIPNRRTDAQDAFDLKTDVYLNWLAGFRTWLAGFRGWLVTFIAELASALQSVEGNKNAAQAAAAAAEVSAQNAAVISGAERWVPRNYVKGEAVWSPISLLTYRRIPEGPSASASDPCIDKANWRLTGSPHSMPQQEITTALDAITGLPHLLTVGVHYIVLHPLAVCSMPVDAVAQEMVRVTNRSGATTPKLLRNGSLFDGDDDDLQLDSLTADKTFTKTATRGWL